MKELKVPMLLDSELITDRNLAIGTFQIVELQTTFREARETLLSRLHPGPFGPRQPKGRGNFLSELFYQAFDPRADLDAPFHSARSSP